jgi:PKD repeat protein
MANGFSCRLLIAVVACALSACGGRDDVSRPTAVNHPPLASFTLSPSSGIAPLVVQVDAAASTDGDGSIARYSWIFGDDSATGVGVALSHTYQVAGDYTITLTVTDNLGTTGSTSRQVAVTNDSSPTIAVVEPLDLSVGLPMVPLDASCTDDRPGCIVEVVVNGQVQMSAPTAIKGNFDLSPWVGYVEMLFRARDSAGQVNMEYRRVYSEDAARLTKVAEVSGEILDADGRRLLFVASGNGEGTGYGLAIYDIASGTTEPIPLPDGKLMGTDIGVINDQAFLTPTGAMILTGVMQEDYPSSFTAHIWKAGKLTQVLFPARHLEVSGAYAAFVSGVTLYRANTATDTIEPVGEGFGSVSADGTAVYSSKGAYQIIRDRLGEQVAITEDSSHWHYGPLTDGDRILYTRASPYVQDQQRALMLFEDGVAIALTPESPEAQSRGSDYQIADGWVAYLDYGSLSTLQTYTRSPLGVITRHTDLDSDTNLERLAGNGEVMLFVFDQRKRCFSRGQGLLPVSSPAGKSYWLNETWYVSIGRAFMAVDTRE